MALATVTEALTQKRANNTYDTDGSVEKVKLFIEAVRFLLDTPDEMFHGGGQADGYRNNYMKWQRQLDDALAWWRANDADANVSSGGGGVVYLSNNGGFRD